MSEQQSQSQQSHSDEPVQPSAELKSARKFLMSVVSVLEALGCHCGVDINGWSESTSENIDEYDEVLSVLYPRYREWLQETVLAPEVRLPLMLLGSAWMFYLSRKMFANMPRRCSSPEKPQHRCPFTCPVASEAPAPNCPTQPSSESDSEPEAQLGSFNMPDLVEALQSTVNRMAQTGVGRGQPMDQSELLQFLMR